MSGAVPVAPEPLSAPAISAEEHARIDQLEAAMLATGAVVDMPLIHRFTPGIYTRMIFNPAGSLITTKVHKVEHPFILLRGRLSVWTPEGVVEHLAAPHFGITKAGTRRVIYVHEDSIFITFHPNASDTQDLEALEALLISPRDTEGEELTANQVYRALLAAASEVSE